MYLTPHNSQWMSKQAPSHKFMETHLWFFKKGKEVDLRSAGVFQRKGNLEPPGLFRELVVRPKVTDSVAVLQSDT